MSISNSNPPPAENKPGKTFPKSVRLLKSAEFDAVYGLRQSASDNLLVVHGRENGLTHARLGLTVSRRVGNAVVRNRWKRALREAFRQVRHQLPKLDLIVTPRPGVQPIVAKLMISLPALARRVEKRLQSGAAPYPPRGKQSKKKPGRPDNPSPDLPT